MGFLVLSMRLGMLSSSRSIPHTFYTFYIDQYLWDRNFFSVSEGGFASPVCSYRNLTTEPDIPKTGTI